MKEYTMLAVEFLVQVLALPPVGRVTSCLGLGLPLYKMVQLTHVPACLILRVKCK